MITEKEICQAIDESLKEPITGNKRAVLADLIIIRDYLFGEPPIERESQTMPMQSFPASPIEQVETIIETDGDSEFLKAVDGKRSEGVLKLMDELVEAVKILHPRMYAIFIDKIQDL